MILKFKRKTKMNEIVARTWKKETIFTMPVERYPRWKKSLFIFVNFIIMNYFPEYDVKLISCVLGIILNSSIDVQGMTGHFFTFFFTFGLWMSLCQVDEAVLGGWGCVRWKTLIRKGCDDSLLNWCFSHFGVWITLSSVRQGDSVAKPNYFNYEWYFVDW